MKRNSLHKLFDIGVAGMVMVLVLAACAPAAAPVASSDIAVPAATAMSDTPVAPAVLPDETQPTNIPDVPNTGYEVIPTVAIPVTGGGIMLNVAKDDKLGMFLVDGKGMTLYKFTKDTPGVSNCNAGCLTAWPPLTAGSVSEVTVGSGVDKTKLGLADLADGRKIVTYGGMPLYYWAKDMKPGDTTGQNVGNVWFVVAP